MTVGGYEKLQAREFIFIYFHKAGRKRKKTGLSESESRLGRVFHSTLTAVLPRSEQGIKLF
jgi:hypothetical protein